MSTLVLTITAAESAAFLKQVLAIGPNQKGEFIQDLCAYLKSLGTIRQGSIDVQTGSASPVRASGTYTLASVVEDNVVTIAGTALTFKDAPANENQVDVGVDNATTAANLAAAINAHSVLSLLVSASAAAAVVTVRSLQAGVIGNRITLAKTGDPITESAAALASGAGGAQEVATTYSLGL